MKRRISLVIAFALSFLMMFGSIARAEEIKIQITVTTSEPAKVEVVKGSLAETKEVDSQSVQAETGNRVLEEGKLKPQKNHGSCNIYCDDGNPGTAVRRQNGLTECVPC
jgi:ABC-type uncharacterized transport system substrate-binding protein